MTTIQVALICLGIWVVATIISVAFLLALCRNAPLIEDDEEDAALG